MKLAIMQPCYLPWRGYFALMRLCDVFVHLDDVALPQGRSYQTRSALRTRSGRCWLSLPVRRRSGEAVRDAELAGDGWRRKHLQALRQELPTAAAIVADLYERPWRHVAALNVALAERIARALGFGRPGLSSSGLAGPGRGSDRILSLCRTLRANRYLTGHGSRNYLDHAAFERHGIEVLYLDYDLSPYPQPGDDPFDPYVTVLDVIERAADPARHVDAGLVPWRQFTEVRAAR